MSDPNRPTAPVPPKEWHELPALLAMANLVFMRDWMRNSNLYDTEVPPLPAHSGPVPQEKLHARTFDGSWNDLKYPSMGSVGRRFGRNVPLGLTHPDPGLLDPNPREISRELMTRGEFIPAPSINLLAAAWIQFQVHDWFVHKEHPTNVHAVPRPAGDTWPVDPLRVPKTEVDGTSTGGPAYANLNSHWWDASQIYGNSEHKNSLLRTGHDGKIRVHQNGLLELDQATGEELTGFLVNGWIGVSMLHGIFALEHNAICDQLKKKNPGWNDEQLHQTARLVVAALLAKIHTLEWTTAVLDTNLMRLAMSVNWRGLLGKFGDLTDAFDDDELLNGIIGSATDHHTAPYAMTEEFVAVYRMHPLMPDEFTFRSITTNEPIGGAELPGVLGKRGRAVLEKYGMSDLFYSLGVANPGAITLQNYPKHLQNLNLGEGDPIDLATVEIVRDRERGVPRYNEFRRLVGKRPIRTFEELTTDQGLLRKLEQLYGTVDRIDAMVGLLAERPPKGFAFSDTAFRIFILMASRRLKSDRFFTEFWKEHIYSKEGIEWVDKNTMTTILRRHFREIEKRLGKKKNAFQPWEK
jgi:heme peroxidase